MIVPAVSDRNLPGPVHGPDHEDWLADHLVRVGVLGALGRFRGADAIIYPRGSRVVCRTWRGLEVGEVLVPRPSAPRPPAISGTIVRAMTAADELWYARLQKNRQQAYEDCVQRLRDLELDHPLVDVELLFEGGDLYFYFLGSLSTEFQAVVEQLAGTYAARVKVQDFVAAVEQGCGPGCGTQEGPGCGSGCSSCPVAEACSPRVGRRSG